MAETAYQPRGGDSGHSGAAIIDRQEIAAEGLHPKIAYSHCRPKPGGQNNDIVEAMKPDGSKRVIVFQRGRATGHDDNQADRSSFKTSRQGDLTIVHIDDERYMVPDIAINGG